MFIFLKIFFLISCIKGVKSNQSSETNNTAQLKANAVDELIYKYSNSTSSFGLTDLMDFLDNFPKLLSSSQSLSQRESLACLNRYVSKVKNLTSLLNNQTRIDKKKLSVVSLFLVSYVEKCFSSKTIEIEILQHEHANAIFDVFNYFNSFKNLYENALELKKEGRREDNIVLINFNFFDYFITKSL